MPTSPSTDQNTSKSTFRLLLVIWKYLSYRRRVQLGMLLVVMVGSGTAELISLSAVFPFLAVISSPDKLWQQPFVQDFATRLGYSESSQIILPVTFIFAVTAVITAVIRLGNLWLNGRLAAAIGSDLSCEAYIVHFISHIRRI